MYTPVGDCIGALESYRVAAAAPIADVHPLSVTGFRAGLLTALRRNALQRTAQLIGEAQHDQTHVAFAHWHHVCQAADWHQRRKFLLEEVSQRRTDLGEDQAREVADLRRQWRDAREGHVKRSGFSRHDGVALSKDGAEQLKSLDRAFRADLLKLQQKHTEATEYFEATCRPLVRECDTRLQAFVLAAAKGRCKDHGKEQAQRRHIQECTPDAEPLLWSFTTPPSKQAVPFVQAVAIEEQRAELNSILELLLRYAGGVPKWANLSSNAWCFAVSQRRVRRNNAWMLRSVLRRCIARCSRWAFQRLKRSAHQPGTRRSSAVVAQPRVQVASRSTVSGLSQFHRRHSDAFHSEEVETAGVPNVHTFLRKGHARPGDALHNGEHEISIAANGHTSLRKGHTHHSDALHNDDVEMNVPNGHTSLRKGLHVPARPRPSPEQHGAALQRHTIHHTSVPGSSSSSISVARATVAPGAFDVALANLPGYEDKLQLVDGEATKASVLEEHNLPDAVAAAAAAAHHDAAAAQHQAAAEEVAKAMRGSYSTESTKSTTCFNPALSAGTLLPDTIQGYSGAAESASATFGGGKGVQRGGIGILPSSEESYLDGPIYGAGSPSEDSGLLSAVSQRFQTSPVEHIPAGLDPSRNKRLGSSSAESGGHLEPILSTGHARTSYAGSISSASSVGPGGVFLLGDGADESDDSDCMNFDRLYTVPQPQSHPEKPSRASGEASPRPRIKVPSATPSRASSHALTTAEFTGEAVVAALPEPTATVAPVTHVAAHVNSKPHDSMENVFDTPASSGSSGASSPAASASSRGVAEKAPGGRPGTAPRTHTKELERICRRMNSSIDDEPAAGTEAAPEDAMDIPQSNEKTIGAALLASPRPSLGRKSSASEGVGAERVESALEALPSADEHGLNGSNDESAVDAGMLRSADPYNLSKPTEETHKQNSETMGLDIPDPHRLSFQDKRSIFEEHDEEPFTNDPPPIYVDNLKQRTAEPTPPSLQVDSKEQFTDRFADAHKGHSSQRSIESEPVSVEEHGEKQATEYAAMDNLHECSASPAPPSVAEVCEEQPAELSANVGTDKFDQHNIAPVPPSAQEQALKHRAPHESFTLSSDEDSKRVIPEQRKSTKDSMRSHDQKATADDFTANKDEGPLMKDSLIVKEHHTSLKEGNPATAKESTTEKKTDERVPAEYFITLKRSEPGEKLGIRISAGTDNLFWKVDSLNEDGMIAVWNEQHKKQRALQVRDGDHIIEVNGAQNMQDMATAFKQNVLQIKLRRNLPLEPQDDGDAEEYDYAEEEEEEQEEQEEEEKEESDEEDWACPVCTLRNSPGYTICAACDEPKPATNNSRVSAGRLSSQSGQRSGTSQAPQQAARTNSASGTVPAFRKSIGEQPTRSGIKKLAGARWSLDSDGDSSMDLNDPPARASE